ncbi:MAG TPA: MerR family transcriptional regulator [Thermomicrobiales bacterium]|nr:MerR family transcriptional regulator [Thermomicrobiales bacterium]
MAHYSLAQLTDAAGVSVRTVRYYVAEGLLPPPVSAGPKSHYTQAHLDRLRLIGQLKASYLPLREIRRYLDRLDDEDVRHLAEQAVAETGETSGAATGTLADQLPPPLAPPPQPDSAADYLARVMNRSPGVRPPKPPITHQPSPTTQSWRRVPLGDDAELLIREEAYQRKQERVDWLIEWARKVLG